MKNPVLKCFALSVLFSLLISCSNSDEEEDLQAFQVTLNMAMPDGIVDLSATSEVLLQDFGYFEAGSYNIHDITISDYFPQTFNIRFIAYYNPDSMEINPGINYAIGAWDPTDQITPKFQVQVDILHEDAWISFDTGLEGNGLIAFNIVEEDYREGYFEFTVYAYDEDFNQIAELDGLGQFFANERYHPGEDRQMSQQNIKIKDFQWCAI